MRLSSHLGRQPCFIDLLMNGKELLKPSLCVEADKVRSFLRESRHRSDDNLHNILPRTGSCSEVINKVLFPEWSSRDRILKYCDSVADSKLSSQQSSTSEGTTSEPEKSPIDPRMDPYGARDFNVQKISEGEAIRTWVNNEQTVESIVRYNSAALLANKCGNRADRPENYLDMYSS